MKVKYAVIPCAGKGTRFLPITKGVAKEMCPIVDRPTLDYIVEECLEAGITDIVFIVSKDKEDIRKYYSIDEEYEKELREAGKDNFADIIHKIGAKARYHFVIQHEQLGLGHAVLQAKSVVKNDNFVVCCGDDICTYEEKTVVGGQKVPHENIVKYGAMGIKSQINERLFSLSHIVEKPKLEEAPSDLASLGKWVFNAKIFDALEKTPKGAGGEIQLTDAIALLMKEEDVYYYDFIGKRYDCGDKLGYLEAIIDVALSRDEFRKGLIAHIKSLKLD